MSQTKIEFHLREYRRRSKNLNVAEESRISELIERMRLAAVAVSDQVAAKQAWCLATTLEVQNLYSKAFGQLKRREYYEGWCTLERVEITLAGLERHMPLYASYGLDDIDRLVRQWQSLFPYRVFLSPSYTEKERKCSICEQPILLRERCDHQVGEIYDGKKCINIITMAELLETSFVTDPVQKYSVPFLKDPRTGATKDHYDYSFVEYVARALINAYDGWSIERTTRRHPHSRYRHVGRNDTCPCERGKKYKACCLREEGVLRPHVEIHFDGPVTQELPSIQYSRSA